jgi:hypothetical protein
LEYSTIIDRLEEEIRQYRVEYQRFFNGDAPVPPEAQAGRIRRDLTRLTADGQLSAVDRFRYNSLVELFRRRLRDLNQAQRPPLAPPPPAQVVVELGGEASADAADALYDAVYAGRTGVIDRDDFRRYLDAQAAKMRHRTGCDKVRFTVSEEQGELKLKARALRSPRPARSG